MKNDLMIKSIFWGLLTALVAVGCYFIVHNAAWLIGDDAQVFTYTGWDTPIYGFFVHPSFGRFFPLDYTLYDILCLFYEGQIGPTPHYVIHAICFVVYCFTFALISLRILKDTNVIAKYFITFCVVVVVVGRTYLNFIQCWTGIWTIYVFLALSIYLAIKFFDTKNWLFGVLSLLSINYVLYYYETMFAIPVAIGACALLFSYNQQDKRERIFNWLMIASGVLFLLLYVIIVVPQIEHAYHHYTEDSLLENAFKMFFAQKIMWLVVVFGIVRIIAFIRKKATYNFYDSLLLASCAYCCGAAVLHLNYTLYYTPAILCAIPAILYFSNKYLKTRWTIVLFIFLALFYGRKIPKDTIENQKERIGTVENIAKLNEYSDCQLYYYQPDNAELNEGDLDVRACFNHYICSLAGWYRGDRYLSAEVNEVFDENKSGIWIVYVKDLENFEEQYQTVKKLNFKVDPLSFFIVK